MARKVGLRPLEEPVIKGPVDSEHMTESSSLDDYEESVLKEKKEEFKDSERDEMANEILSLRNENDVLREENQRLKEKVEELSKQSEKQVKIVGNDELNKKIEVLCNMKTNLETQLKSVATERDSFRDTIRNLQSKIDSFNHVYTRTPYDGRGTVINRTGMSNLDNNGYQDWR